MPDSKVLLVIDLQNDYLWDKRKPMFTYATDNLINNVNKAIASYRGNGYDIIYIKHILPDNAFVRNLVGFSVEGSEGADIYRGVNRVSDLVFEKNRSDTYTSPVFRRHMKTKNYKEVVICGLDEYGCVGATARGACKTGVKVIMLTSCIGSRFSEKKVKKQREKLTSLGVIYHYE